jgi:hypothetical protein
MTREQTRIKQEIGAGEEDRWKKWMKASRWRERWIRMMWEVCVAHVYVCEWCV